MIVYSTGLRNKLLGGVPARHVATITDTSIAAVDGGASADSFTDSNEGFITAGISVGDSILCYGFTGGMAAIHGPFTVLTVAAGTITVITGSLADDAASESVTLVVLTGGSIKDIFKDGVLRFYSGTQPANADAAATGTLLLTVTVASGAFSAGAVTNGIEFGAAAAGMISKNTDVWSGVALDTGTVGWWRLYANATDAGGASSVLPRIDGSVSEEGLGGDIEFADTDVVTSSTYTVDTFTITMAASQA
jgi:hypothetical protein